MDWKAEIEQREDEIIKETQAFLQIESVLDENSKSEKAPFGTGIREAYDWLLNKAKNDGFIVKDLNGYAAHIEYGEGDEIIGVLCHIDVVPGGDDWTSPAFSAEIREGRIFARGVLDDKGPTISCYYALKIIKETASELGKRVRLIIGTDEESQWRCVDHYFKHEEMPLMGFAPDADFPIIYAEKGICDIKYSMESKEKGTIQFFQSGQRLNMVPDRASVRLNLPTLEEGNKMEEDYQQFLQLHGRSGTSKSSGNDVELAIEGISAHGMEPEEGINAGLLLAKFIVNFCELTEQESSYFTILVNNFYNDSRGKMLGVAFTDNDLGDLTINVGQMNYTAGGISTIGINLRYPEGAVFEDVLEGINIKLVQRQFTQAILKHEPPHAMDKNHKLVETLSKVYEGQTGEEASLLAIGGGTYARSLKAGVAFGPLMPNQKDTAHQANESMLIKDLLKVTAIYAEAIYELAKK